MMDVNMKTPLWLCLSVAILYTVCPVTAGASCHDLPNAVSTSKLTTIKQLFETKKCNPNTRRSSDNYTLLHVAIERIDMIAYWDPYDTETASIIKYLLSKGANVKVPFPTYAELKGYTPLHWAAFSGNMLLVPLFIKYGAKVNAVDQRGYTPLHSAARCDFRLSCDDCTPSPKTKITDEILWKLGAYPTMKYLLSKGANILAKNNNKATALDLVPTPCDLPGSSCVEFGATKCSDLCMSTGRKLSWPTGSCKKSYFFAKDVTSAKLRG